MRSSHIRRLVGAFLLSACAVSPVWAQSPAQSPVQSPAPKRGGDIVMTLDATGMAILNTELTSQSPALWMADVWADGAAGP